jgi:hypothetical protein
MLFFLKKELRKYYQMMRTMGYVPPYMLHHGISVRMSLGFFFLMKELGRVLFVLS